MRLGYNKRTRKPDYKMRMKLRSTSRRSSRVEEIQDEQFLGKEPKFKDGHTLTNSEWLDSLNWYSYTKIGSDARQYLIDYYECQEDEDYIELVNKTSDDYISFTAAWNARIIVNGYNLPADLNKVIDMRVEASYLSTQKLEKESKEKVVPLNVISIHERFNIRLSGLIADLEGVIDSEDWSFNLFDYLQGKEILSQYSEKIVEYYKPILDELMEAYNGTDVDLVEAYRFLGRPELKNRINFFKKFIADGERHCNLNKKARKERKKKVISPDKLVEKVQYQKDCKEYNIISIKPIKLIGSNEVWLYNSRYNFITVLRASDKTGLTVKGTTIIGFDEKTSMSKRAGRKVGQWIGQVLKGGKVDLRKLMGEIKTDPIALTGRIGPTTCILRIF